jgi:hypothetical protein
LKFPELAQFIDAHIAKLNEIPKTINTQLNVIGVGVGGEGGSVAGSGVRSGGAGGSVMGANSLWQQAVDWWAGRQNAGGSGDSSQGGTSTPIRATKRQKFDAEFKLARAKYERGTYTIPEYLAELRRLQRVYEWPKHSDPGMAIWREIQRAEDDRRDAMKPARGDRPAVGEPTRPPREPGTAPGGPSSTNRMGGAGAGSGGGVTLVINAPNAVMVDRKAVQEVFDRYAPNINRALAKYRNGAG